jgi:hypothetical protein
MTATSAGAAASAAPPKCSPKPIDVAKIPAIMRAKGMPTGAALMEEWFSLSSSVTPSFAATDSTTVTMAWALGFPRAEAVHKQILSDKIYMSSAAQAVIATHLKRLGVDKGGVFDFNLPVETLDPDYDVQYASVGSVIDPLDDMKAALGRFTFRVVIAGNVKAIKNTGVLARWGITAPVKFQVNITDVGVHIRDSYDFEGSQPLGCWNTCTGDVGNVSCNGGVYVDNSDFRAWRTANGRGGDIKVLSDVKVTHLAPPDSFFLP